MAAVALWAAPALADFFWQVQQLHESRGNALSEEAGCAASAYTSVRASACGLRFGKSPPQSAGSAGCAEAARLRVADAAMTNIVHATSSARVRLIANDVRGHQDFAARAIMNRAASHAAPKPATPAPPKP